MKNRLTIALVMFVLLTSSMTALYGEVPAGREEQILKIKVMAGGDIYAGDVQVDLKGLQLLLDQLKTVGGKVWYYREQGTAEAPPAVMEVIKAIADRGLPTSFSSKPDFSDYIDGSGKSHSRN